MTYTIKAEHFDWGTKWGVAIELGDGRRWAARVEDGTLTEQEAIDKALPQLLEWAKQT